MNKKVRVELSPEAGEALNALEERAKTSKVDRSILNSYKYNKNRILNDPAVGDSIKKDRIPKEFIIKYDINNLFRIELSNFWRMFYTLHGDDKRIEIIAFVLDIGDHNYYDKKMGYKRDRCRK